MQPPNVKPKNVLVVDLKLGISEVTPRESDRPCQRRSAFSLIEMLIVMAVMGAMLAVVAPSFVSIGGGQTVTQAAYSVPDLFTEARAHAMANNTYVYVGLRDDISTKPEGLVSMAIVASNDGLGSAVNALTVNDVTPINKLIELEGVKLDTPAARSVLATYDTQVNLGDEITANSVISFPAEVISNTFAGDPAFTAVVQFAPTGAARLDAVSSAVPSYATIGFVPAQGNTNNVFAVQIDGPSGVTRTFRPQ